MCRLGAQSTGRRPKPDSILILGFSKAARGGRIALVHVNVPEYDHKGVREGWPKYYWKPWNAYIAQ